MIFHYHKILNIIFKVLNECTNCFYRSPVTFFLSYYRFSLSILFLTPLYELLFLLFSFFSTIILFKQNCIHLMLIFEFLNYHEFWFLLYLFQLAFIIIEELIFYISHLFFTIIQSLVSVTLVASILINSYIDIN